MTFVPLVQAWEASRQERTPLPAARRVASIEYGSPSKKPSTLVDWLLDRDDDEITVLAF